MQVPLGPAEIVSLVTSEIVAAITAVDTDGVATFTRVVVRVGEPAATFDDIAWQAELTADPRTYRGAFDGGRPPDTAGLPMRIADLPVSAISGVSVVWTARLASVGVRSIGDLAEADRSVLDRLANSDGSRRVFTLASRARLCEILQVPSVPDRGLALHPAVALSPLTLAKTFDLDVPGAVALSDALARLASVLDASVLDEMTFDWLYR